MLEVKRNNCHLNFALSFERIHGSFLASSNQSATMAGDLSVDIVAQDCAVTNNENLLYFMTIDFTKPNLS